MLYLPNKLLPIQPHNPDPIKTSLWLFTTRTLDLNEAAAFLRMSPAVVRQKTRPESLKEPNLANAGCFSNKTCKGSDTYALFSDREQGI